MAGWRLWLVRRARVLVVLCVLGMLLPFVTRWIAHNDGRVAWLIDLAAHWQWLYAAGLLPTTLIAAFADRRWAIALLALPLPWFSAAAVAPHADVGDANFIVATANVYLENTDVRPLAQWLAIAQPDVVIVLEVSPLYAQGLRALSDYPHQQIVAANDPFGIALLSRHPFTAVEVVREASEPARIDAWIQTPQSCVNVIALHPMPPISTAFHQARNARLRALALAAHDRDMPTVIAGDLNATPWSSAFAGLAAHGLRRASDLRPSWPSIGHGLFGIPIDHVLVSDHWSVHSSSRGPDIGSDHRPLMVGLGGMRSAVACAGTKDTR